MQADTELGAALSHQLENHTSDKGREVEEREPCSIDRHNSQRTDRGGQEEEHIYLRLLLWCITPILSRIKMGAVADEWLSSKEESRVIPKALTRENDYFLAKWSWLVWHLNLLRWNLKQILKHRRYAVGSLQSYWLQLNGIISPLLNKQFK